MPESTLALVDGGGQVMRARAIGQALAGLASSASDTEEANQTVPDPRHVPPDKPRGPATGFTCPECRGAIWEEHDGGVRRFRCRIGHAFSEDAMVTQHGAAVEAALWSALEILEERAELLRRIAGARVQQSALRQRFTVAAEDADQRAELIRRALAAGSPGADAFSVEAPEG